jgi:hypothetical protein
VCVIASFACGGGEGGGEGPSRRSPSGPSAPMPTASIQLDGKGELKSCALAGLTIRCDFEDTGRNAGPGCATRVRGTVRFLNEASEQVAIENWFLENTRVLAPNESFAYAIRLNVRPEAFKVIVGITQQPMWTNTLR